MDKEWIVNVIEKIAEYGTSDTGLNRLAYSKEDQAARSYFKTLMQEAGLSVREDAMGNIIARLEGTEKDAAVVATGSHLDTVPNAGKYDGVFGVVGGLAAIQRLKERGPLAHPVELIIFMAEESSRFGFATMGSKAMAGFTNRTAWSKAKDQDGISFPAALKEQGLDLDRLPSAVRSKDEFKAFVELHIEQGPILERDRLQIGVVEAIAAPTRLKITVEGFPAHSGTTPMEDRHDALVSASMIVLAVREIALEQSDRGTVGTVGGLKVDPGVMNVVPGKVEMWVDIRGVDHESIIETLQDVKDTISTIADEQETPVSIEVLTSDKPVKLSKEVSDAIEKACTQVGVSYRRMNSGAGHDAMNMAHIAPTGMVFVPCHQGISHNPEESVTPDEMEAGVKVLTETLYLLAK